MHSHGCKAFYGENKPCLNPCFNGRCTSTLVTNPQPLTLVSLNPCFNGRCTSTQTYLVKYISMQSLNPCFNGRCTSTSNNIKNSETYDVLILVLMEDALVLVEEWCETC